MHSDLPNVTEKNQKAYKLTLKPYIVHFCCIFMFFEHQCFEEHFKIQYLCLGNGQEFLETLSFTG